MGERLPYNELVEQVQLLQSQLDERIANYMWIRREPASGAPTALDGGTAVYTSTGLFLGVDGGVVSATLS